MNGRPVDMTCLKYERSARLRLLIRVELDARTTPSRSSQVRPPGKSLPPVGCTRAKYFFIAFRSRAVTLGDALIDLSVASSPPKYVSNTDAATTARVRRLLVTCPFA